MMKKSILILIGFFVMHFSCIAQKEIIYNFEKCVIDSLQQGIKMYSQQLHKASNSLKLYAVVIENNNEFEIFFAGVFLFAKKWIVGFNKKHK